MAIGITSRGRGFEKAWTRVCAELRVFLCRPSPKCVSCDERHGDEPEMAAAQRRLTIKSGSHVGPEAPVGAHDEIQRVDVDDTRRSAWSARRLEARVLPVMHYRA